MNPISRAALATAAVLAASTLSPAISGTIDPALEMRLRAASAETEFRVVAVLDDRPDVATLAHQLYLEGWDPAVRHERVIRDLRGAAARSQGPLLRLLRAGERSGAVSNIEPLWIVNAIAFEARPEVIRAAAAVTGVFEIDEDSEIELEEPVSMSLDAPHIQAHEWGLDMIHAPQLWALGFDGTGTTVCNLDTGVEGTHPALQSKWRGAGGGDWRHHWFDPSTGSDHPIDDSYHGTHTMGIMVGSEVGDTVGVAPGAQWIAALTIGGSGDFVSKTLLAFQWAADPDGDPGTADQPDVISNSWTDLQPKCQNTLYEAIDNVEAAGAAVVFSAGNSGPASESITSPKNRATTPVNIFATGALRSDGVIASFSSRGPSACDHTTIKPEAAAPGDNVRSTMPSGYGLLSGTSMASPHVAGAVALLKQVNPGLDPETVKTILIETARDAGTPGEDNTYGNGIIDLYEAYIVASSGYGTLAGRVEDAATGDPLAAKITAIGTPRGTRAGEDGLFLLPLPADSLFTIEAAFFGYLPALFDINVTAGDTLRRLVQLAAAPVGSIAGRVVDAAGDAVSGADVAILDTPFAPIQSGADGSYRFAGVPADSTYTVAASYCGLTPAGRLAAVVAGEETMIDITLPELAPDDMESGENGWTHQSVTSGFGDQWHLSTRRNHTPGGTTAWKCGDTGSGDYDNSLDAGLRVHCVNLAPGSQLAFWHWIDAEVDTGSEAWDGGIVEISTDGENYTQITPQGGYPYTIVDNDASPFAPGTPCFSGTHDWRRELFDLSAYTGDAYLRFRFGTDGYVTEEGWYIDDLVVSAETPAVTIVASGAPAQVAPGSTAEWEITLSNESAEQQSVDVWLHITQGSLEVDRLLATGVVLPAGAGGTESVLFPVPGATPPGSYTVENIVGLYPALPYSSDSFVTDVTALR